ncbi:MAG: glucosaminidase domain-containing protein [Acidobacteria bacterium]|nr:glucosaminidase domain-containing protein [Acidobacteriota bacterium]
MRTLSKGFFVVAGLLSPAPMIDSATLTPLYFEEDPRLVRVREFFLAYDSPAYALADEFLHAADANDLDWRLLPAISLIESGGGKEYRRNNILGWANGRKRFSSVRAGIHAVASQLANSDLYRDKNAEGILRTYNTSRVYSRKVLSLMETLGPAKFPAGGALN